MIAPDRVLVLMACGGNKLPGAAAPRDLYLGPMWQTLRLWIGAVPWRNVFVISGRYGLISAETIVETYEQRLEREAADRMIAAGAPIDVMRAIDGQPFERVL